MSVRFLAPVALMGVAVASCLSGCSGDGRVPVYPVTGKVTFNGKGVENASVVFHPTTATPGVEVPKARGKTGPDGTFKLTTYVGDDGAPKGDYKVTVELWLTDRKTDDGPKSWLAPKFAKPETSGLSATVNVGPTDVPAFEVAR